MSQRISYTRVAVWLHWIIGGLIIALLAGGLLMGYIPKDNTSLRMTVYNWHKTLGMLILVLSVARLFWRLTHKPPAPLAGLKTWEKQLAKLIHVLFYVFMIAMPLVGWAIISTSRFPSYFFNWTKARIPEMPFWQDLDKAAKGDIHHLFEDVHEKLAYVAIALILLHIIGALKHHRAGQAIFVRMIPSLANKKDKKP